MKNLLIAGSMLLLSATALSQVGVGTTSPHSTLDVRGSIALAYRSFTGATSAAITDNTLIFTGTSATTLTLPTAVGISGRSYWIKNASSNSSALTIATTSSQTIDGATSLVLTQQNRVVNVVSNGTSWYIASESIPGAVAGTSWILGGNNVPSQQNFGTTSNFSLPFLTNNVERMRITNTGNVGIGTSTFNGTYPEKLLVDAGTTTSYNVISGKGSINSYLQLNIQNNNTGTAASSDLVATSNNGNESVNFVNLGINGGGNTSTGQLGGANTAYLYSTGNDFVIGNGTNNAELRFFTTASSTYAERMRIDGPTGNVAIGSTSFDGTHPEKLLINAGTTTSNNLIKATGSYNGLLKTSTINSSSGTSASADFVAFNNAGNILNAGINSSGYTLGGIYGGASTGYLYSTGNDFVIGNATSGRNLILFTGGTATTNERMRINGSGNVAIGTTTFNSTNPEKLLVDAGTTSSYNVISGKGSINSYLQLNIQNNSSGTTASSDLVATANNGTESVNFVNLGINGGGNTSTGQLGGANTAYLYSTGNDFVVGNGTNDAELRFFTTTSSVNRERMRIDGTTGNLAIGATSFNGTAPERLLVDAGTTTSYNVISGKGSINNYLQLNIQNQSSGSAASSDVVATANDGNESQYFIDMGINSSGYSGSGILGGARTAYLYSTGGDLVIGNGTNDAELRFYTTTGSTGTERMRIDGPTGNVGIGTTSPTAGRKLHVSGGDFRVTNNTINFDIQIGTTLSGHTNAAGVAYYEIGGAETHMFGGQVIPDADNTWTLGINGRRWSAVWAANGTIQTSDIRLKKNILPLNYGLNEIMQMEPVSYDWKDNSGSHKIGLIAQEVKKIVPEVVTGDESKESLGMNYAELVPVLINAVKELKADLEITKKELEELKKTVNKK